MQNYLSGSRESYPLNTYGMEHEAGCKLDFLLLPSLALASFLGKKITTALSYGDSIATTMMITIYTMLP